MVLGEFNSHNFGDTIFYFIFLSDNTYFWEFNSNFLGIKFEKHFQNNYNIKFDYILGWE
jgi:hypothetical protein